LPFSSLLITAICVAFVLGGALTWLVVSTRRSHAEQQTSAVAESIRIGLEARLSATQDRLARAEAEVGERNARIDALTASLSATRDELSGLHERAGRLAMVEDSLRETTAARDRLKDEQGGLRARVAELEATLAQERQNTTEKLALLTSAREELGNHFKSLASDILEQKGQSFTELNRTSLGQILGPLGDNLKRFEDMVSNVYGNERDQRTTLIEQVRQLTELNSTLSQETQNLTHALRGDSKAQGNFGEILLDDVLSRAGLVEGQHFVRQGGVRSEDGRQLVIPDVVLHLPGGRHLVIDSKFTLPDYRAFSSTEDEGERATALKRHILSLRAHVKGLSEKCYQSDYGLRSLDFVVMFVPLEPAFMLAVTHDRELFQFGWEKNVLLVSPSTLLFVVRTVAHLWRQEDLARNALEISKRGGELYDKLVGFVEELQNVGKGLDDAQDAYREARRKLGEGKGNVIRQAEMLKMLGLKPKKALKKDLLERALDGQDLLEIGPGPDGEGATERAGAADPPNEET
jgi:DNA recombination protein RmuC